MRAERLELYGFRNYQAQTVSLVPDINIFLGPNAQGKTNILEAFYYAALGHSHRTQSDGDLIGWQAAEARVRVDFLRLDVPNKVELFFPREKRRQAMLNGQKVTTKGLIGALNVVFFSPEDLFIIKGAPQGRRRFLDMELSQASPSYYHQLSVYTRLLTQRNSLLKAIRERRSRRDQLLLWDEQLCQAAAAVVAKRRQAVERLTLLANLMQRRLSGGKENLQVFYEIKANEAAPKVTEELVLWYNKMLRNVEELDILRGSTSIGPHRDDLVFSVNGVNLKAYGSQGQQRTGVLALKLAELEFLHGETGEYPLLLLDDVMSELDRWRRSELLNFISRKHIQTLITATDEAYFPAGSKGKIFRVQAGRITEE